MLDRLTQSDPIWLRVNDVKQYVYCPRVTFHHRVLAPTFEPTYKMSRGKIEQERIERLESRRKFRKFGLDKAKRRFHVWLTSDRLALSGKLDMLLETESQLIPVDFKLTRRRPGRNHFFQLAAYALLLEERRDVSVETAFIYQIPLEAAVIVSITPELKQRVMEMTEAIREMITRQRMPRPTPHRNRCAACEFRNFCGDVF